MERLDVYERMPEGMRDYLSSYGWHFSKRLAEYATSPERMINAEDYYEGKPKPRSERKHHHWSHEQVEDMLKKHGITIKNAKGHDCMYVANMLYADFYPKTLTSEEQVLKHAKAYIDDPDGYDGIPLTRYYADCIAKGEPLIWEDYM